MWHPIDLHLTNLGTHVSSSFIFNRGRSTFIRGVNLDDEGQKSNGGGKSWVLEGATYATLGTCIRDVVQVDLINNDADFSEIEMNYHNDVTDQHLYIYRQIPRKGSAEVSIKVNGEIPTTLLRNGQHKIDVNDANNYILSLFDISKEDLLNYFLISSDTYTSFFKGGDVGKRKIIGRFSNTNLLDTVDTPIKEDIDAVKKKLDKKREEQLRCETRIFTHMESITELDEEDQDEEIKELQEHNVLLVKEVAELEKTVIANQKAVDGLNTDITKIVIDDKKLEKIKTDKKTKVTEKEGVEKELKEYNTLLTNIENTLAGKITCPKCKHEFVLNEDVTLEEAVEAKETVTKEVDKLDKTFDKLENDINTLIANGKTEEAAIEALQLKLKGIRTQINDIGWQITNDKKKVTQKNNLIEENKQSIIDLQNNTSKEKRKKELDDKIEEEEKLLETIEKELVVLEQEVVDIEQWLTIFKKFKVHLTNKSVKVIEGYTNHYLQKIRTNLSINIEGYKIVKDKVKESITTNVLRNGISEGSFFKFSRGERMRIEVSAILGLQKLINLNSKSGGLDFLFLDEIIDGLDEIGSEYIINSLDTINQTILIIAHNNLQQLNSCVSTVTKQNKVSAIS